MLGSRSPQRRELLARLVPAERIEIVPPPSSEEADFAGLTTWPAIRERLQAIARHKLTQVETVLGSEAVGRSVICADTTIVATAAPHSANWWEGSELCALGQPPDEAGWREVVAEWFRTYYAGRPHGVGTAVVVRTPGGNVLEDVVTTEVWMRPDVGDWLEWYLATDEPRGKAGGYAVQGAGSCLITRIDGSLSNVIGLPLEALRGMLNAAM